MDLKDLTVKELQELQKLFCKLENSRHPFKVGENYLVRTVTMIITGKLQAVYDTEIVVIEACWIADTGRFADSLKTCEFSEVEPFPAGEVIIGRNSIIDAVIIEKLPKEQK